MRKQILIALLSLGLGISGALLGRMALAENPKDSKPAAQPQLPPGWTQAEMDMFIAAATPGKMHERLQQSVGVWDAKVSMWMGPSDSNPVVSPGSSTVTPLMDGRFVRVENKGEMPGMGPYMGMGICGYDNLTKKFVSSWIDNHSTAIMNGTGELSADGKVLTWTDSVTCPRNGKPMVIREVETITGENTKTLEMFSTDPATNKEFKMISIELTRKK